MIAIGTASTIPINPSVLAPTTIHKKISNELTHSVLFIIRGMRTLFSSHWITKNNTPTPTNHAKPWLSVPTSSAGMLPNNGHIYGISSVNHAMIAREKMLGSCIPNSAKISNPIPLIAKMKRHKISWLVSQKPSFSYIIEILWCRLLLCFASNLRINFIVASFSILNNTDKVSTKPTWVRALNIALIILTAIPPAPWRYVLLVLAIWLIFCWRNFCILETVSWSLRYVTRLSLIIDGIRSADPTICSSHIVWSWVWVLLIALSTMLPISPICPAKNGTIISIPLSSTAIKIKYATNMPHPLLLNLVPNQTIIFSTAIENTYPANIR